MSITGLVAGSVVPDFEYFVRDFHHSFYSHTWPGVFYIDMPGGLLLCFLYHGLIREPLYNHVPLFIKRKLAPFQSFNWMAAFKSQWQIILVSILFGAASHLLWDKLTHHTVPLVQSASGFNNFVTPKDRNMTYFLFWDISSLIGAFFVLCTIWWLPSRKQIPPNERIVPYWLLFGGCTLLFFFLQLPYVRLRVLDDTVIALINAILLSVLATSIAFTVRLRLQKASMA